jgi:hypothetical protein
VIAYFDTSALVPLIIDEPGTDRAGDAWDRAIRLVSVRLLYVEARAALAQAARATRISPSQLHSFVRELDDLLTQVDFVDVDEALVNGAATLAEVHSLRAYDAVHLAAALSISSEETVLVAGDHALLEAGQAAGLTIVAVA